MLAWHQVVGGVARTSAEDVIWNYNKDCEPAAAVCDVAANNETVSLSQMDAQFTWLREQGYQSVSAEQYSAWVAGRPVLLPAKPMLLTVDDGTLNSYVGVTALLARHGFNMVTFIVTQFADGASSNTEPYAGWNASWDQLLSLPEEQWSFAFHAGAQGHNITFPDNKACQYFYPCQLPAETVSDYRRRVSGEITTGRETAHKALGAKHERQPVGSCTPGRPRHAANIRLRVIAKDLAGPVGGHPVPGHFHSGSGRNGYLNERYRLEILGTWSLAMFKSNFTNNLQLGFFDARSVHD